MKNALPSPSQPLRIGTRGSPLALWQAHEVRRCLMLAFDLPEPAFEVVVIKVTGDMIQDRALKDIGGKGLFTREIEEALLDGSIDIAVHSMKDMPTLQPDGLLLDCFCLAKMCATPLCRPASTAWPICRMVLWWDRPVCGGARNWRCAGQT